MSSGTARSGPIAPARMRAGLWQRLYFLPLPHQQSSFARNTATPPSISELTPTYVRKLRDVRSWDPSPAPVHPLLEVRPLRANGGVEPVTGEHQQISRQREQAAVDRLDDLGEVAAGQRGVARTAGEERVAAEEDRVTLEQERGGPRGVARVVDGAEPEVADGNDLVVGDDEVVRRQHRRVVGRDPDVDAGVTHRLDGL